MENTPSDKYQEGDNCVDIDQKIKRAKREAIRNKERPTHYFSKIGYFNPIWTDGHKFLVDEIQNHYNLFSEHVQYAITLQTRLITKRDKFRSEQQIITLQEDFWHFKNRLNYHFFGKTGHRKPNIYSLLLLPIIEGSAFSPEGDRTLHYHLGIGNIPNETSFSELCFVIRKHWLKSKF